jgi:hypothetical protein
MELDNHDRGEGSNVGILAIEGKYATATQLAQFLKFFHQHFFGLYEPNHGLVESAQLFFTNPHHVPHYQNLRGALCHPHCSSWTCTPNGMRAFLSRIVVTLSLRGARLDPILFHDPLSFHWESISVQTLSATVTGSSVNIYPLHAAQGSLLLLDSGSCFA